MRRTSSIGIIFGMYAVAMSAETYASFGVSNSVMSSSDPEEHEQNMLALNVSARDGDTSIDLVDPGAKTLEGELVDPEEEQEEKQEEQPDESLSDDNDDSGEETEFTPLGEPDAELTKSSNDIEEYSTGFNELREQAIKAGLSTDVAARIEEEYEANGKLSDDSYAQLAKAGYSKGFVNSFMQGQEAVAEKYIAQIVSYAGGKEQFDRVVAHLKANSPHSMDSLYDAMERRDLNTVRTVINLGMASQTKKFGKQPERSINRRGAAPAGRAAQAQVEGFTSQGEMIKAMSDKRYGIDKVYTAQVESKVQHAAW